MDKLGGLQQEGHPAKKWWDDGEHADSLDGVASSRIVGASAYVIFPCTIKSSKWHHMSG